MRAVVGEGSLVLRSQEAHCNLTVSDGLWCHFFPMNVSNCACLPILRNLF